MTHEQRERIARSYSGSVPHSDDLGIEVIDFGKGYAVMGLPYRKEFLGDTNRGLIHTAVSTSLVDSACGLAVFLALPKPRSIATLDLRMDYLRPAVAGKTLYARAEVHQLTRHIAFVRASVYQDDENRPAALCNAAFMRGSSQRLKNKEPKPA